MALQLLSLAGLMVSGLALYRLQSLVSGWTALLDQLQQALRRDDLEGAHDHCAAQPHTIISQVGRGGLALLPSRPTQQDEAERHFATGLAPMMVHQIKRAQRLGMVALLGALPAAALGLGVSYPSGWPRWVAFGALLLAVLGAWRAHVIRTGVIPRMVAAVIRTLTQRTDSD